MATTVAELEVVVGADVSGAERGLDSVDRKISESKRNVQAAGMAMLGFGAAGAAGMFAAAKSAIGFDAAMNGVQAVVQGSQADFDRLRALALQIGKDTAFGATEGALAITELAKSGVSTTDILSGAAMAAANLAAATGEDIPFAANAMANAMNIFGMGGEQAATAADILVGAANASSAEVMDLAAGLRNLGPIAAQMGVSLTDTATAVALFTNFGLKGADAGVSLTRMLNDLATPTSDARAEMERLGISLFDAQGEFVGFPDLFDQLAGAMGGMNDKQKLTTAGMLVGGEAADVFVNAISAGGDGFRELRKEVDPAGQALKASQIRMQGVSGAMEQLRGSVETAAILLGDVFTPYIKIAAVFLRELVDAFSALPKPMQKVIGFALAASTAMLLLGGGFIVFGPRILSAVRGFQTLITVGGRLPSVFAAIRVAMTLMLGPWGLLIAAVALLAVAYYKNWFGIRDIVNNAVGAIWKQLQRLIGFFQPVIDVLVDLGRYFVGVAKGVNPLGEAFQMLPGWLQPIAYVIARIIKSVRVFFKTWADRGFLAAIGKIEGQIRRFGLSLGWLVARLTGSQRLGAMVAQVFFRLGTIFRYAVKTIAAVVNGDWAAVWTNLGNLARQGGLLIQAILAGVFGPQTAGKIVAAFQAVTGAIATAIQFVWPYLTRFANWFAFTAVPAIVSFGTTVASFVTGTIVPAIVSFVQTVWPYLLRFGNWFFYTAIPAVVAFGTTVYNWVTGTLIPTLSNFWATVSPYLQSFADWLWNTAIPAVTTFGQTVSDKTATVVSTLTGIWESVSGALTSLADWFTNTKATVTTWVDTVTLAISGLVTSVQTNATAIVTSVSGIATSLTGAFANIYNDFFNIGWSIIAGMSAGIQSIWNTLVGWIDSIIGQLDKIPSWLRPGSPSKTATVWGASLVQGLVAGVQGEQGTLAATMRDLTGQLRLDMAPMTAAVRGALGNVAATVAPTLAATAPLAQTRPSGGINGNVTINIPIDGAKDTQAIRQEVRTEIMSTIARLQAGGYQPGTV